jgi:WD40 repeat protein
VADGHEVLSHTVVNGGGNGVSFSPDNRLVAASGSTGVSIWNIADDTRVARLPGAANVQAVRFSPDGTLLATGGQDQTIRIWDVSTNRTILTLTGHSGTINSVAFSPDGTRVASASDDGTVRQYDIVTDRLLRIAQSRLTRGLTVAECRQYLHTDTCPSSIGAAHTPPSGLDTTSAFNDPAPLGAYRVTVVRGDFPPGFNGAKDQLGVYTLSLGMGTWRLFQLMPSGDTWETSGTYRVGPGRRLVLTDRSDPECYGVVMSARWSLNGTSLSFRNARETVTPRCGPQAFNNTSARGLLTSRQWSAVVV